MSSLPSHRTQWIVIIVCVAVLALLFGLWVQHNLNDATPPAAPKLATATVFPQPRDLEPFQLTDDHNQSFTQDALKGHWNLVFFGFTNCPDLCPTALATLNNAYKLLATQQTPLPQIIFISVDPEQDNSARILQYLNSFNPQFIGATGSEEQLNKLTQQLSVIFGKVMPAHGEHYTIDHSGTIVIINPEGKFYGVFTLPHDAQKIAQDMQSIIHAAPPTTTKGQA